MKKIINGKKYDTETAKKLGEWWNNSDVRNFNHCEESLFIKRTGEYFLYGYGGPSTKYRVCESDNTYTGGEAIKPLTEAEAREWAQEHLEADEYEEIFGAVEE